LFAGIAVLHRRQELSRLEIVAADLAVVAAKEIGCFVAPAVAVAANHLELAVATVPDSGIAAALAAAAETGALEPVVEAASSTAVEAAASTAVEVAALTAVGAAALTAVGAASSTAVGAASPTAAEAASLLAAAGLAFVTVVVAAAGTSFDHVVSAVVFVLLAAAAVVVAAAAVGNRLDVGAVVIDITHFVAAALAEDFVLVAAAAFAVAVVDKKVVEAAT